MPSYRTGTVSAVLAERPGLQRVEVDGEPAYVLTALVGPVAVGDRVVVNTTAVDLGLGTGGWHVVHWNLSREAWSAPGGGHVLKLRYTSLQADTGVAEEEQGWDPPPSLDGFPVVAIGLHSQLAPVAEAFKAVSPSARLAYVMTDAGALPLALSDLVAALVEAGLVDVTVTAGHAFGGDHEAVNVRSALDVAAAHAHAAVVGAGPGVVGTGTRHGFSPLEVAAIVDAADAAGAAPIVALRVSDADARGRHRGVSHHSVTALAQARSAADVAVPRGEPAPPVDRRHRVVEVDLPGGAGGVEATTMGRGRDEEPRFFGYAAAAGALAAARVPWAAP